MWRQPPRLSREGAAERLSSTHDANHRFFALDSLSNFLHSEITSPTSSAAGPAKLMFACQP
jgi:hypothetical protein